MSAIVLNERGFVLLRPRVRDTEMTWAEVSYVRGYKIGGNTGMILCLDVGSEEGSFVAVDEEMEGYGAFLEEFPKHVEPDYVDWKEQLAGLATGALAGYLEIYRRGEKERAALSGGGAGVGSGSEEEAMVRPEFPRSGKYSAGWVMENGAGPNVLWMMEWLTEGMQLRPGMRVLDLSCGRGLGSIFLAREFEVMVWAADWWVKPTMNRVRAEESGVGEKVFPIRAKTHSLPFADGFFDAIVSVNAFHYFGTGDLYLGYLQKFLKKGGELGIAGPGVREEVVEVPGHLKEYWQWSYWGLHSAGWWKRHWERTGLLNVERAEAMDWGARLWAEWSGACGAGTDAEGREACVKEEGMLKADRGRTLGLMRVVGRKN